MVSLTKQSYLLNNSIEQSRAIIPLVLHTFSYDLFTRYSGYPAWES